MENEHSEIAKSLRLAVFGFYGNENLGDEAIVEAVIDNFRNSIPGATLQCISVQPVDSEERHKVHADAIFLPSATYKSQRDRIAEQQDAMANETTPAGDLSRNGSQWQSIKGLPLVRHAITLVRHIMQLPATIKSDLEFRRHVREVISRTDVLLISGSNQFLDNFGGPFAFPYTLWIWTLFAKRRKVPIAVMSVGAGPIFSKLSMWFIRRVIIRAEYLSLRDVGSVELLGLNPATTNVSPDLAFSHDSDTVRTALQRDLALRESPVIAINPMAVHAKGYWYEVNDDKYTAYVEKLATLVQHMEKQGSEFVFLSNQPRDELVIQDVISVAVDMGSSRVALESRCLASKSVEDYLQNASKADIIIATRFHATVLALLLARPVIGLCYYKKSAELLREFSLGDYVFDIDEFCPDDVARAIESLTNEFETSARTIAKRVEQYREQLRRQYEDVSTIVFDKQ